MQAAGRQAPVLVGAGAGGAAGGGRAQDEQVVADGGELGHDLGDQAGLALPNQHPHQRPHPRVEHLLLRIMPPATATARCLEEEGARVAGSAEQRAGADGRVGQRGRISRGGAGAAASAAELRREGRRSSGG